MQSFSTDVSQGGEKVIWRDHTYGHPSMYQVFYSVRQMPFKFEMAHSVKANLNNNTYQTISTLCLLQDRVEADSETSSLTVVLSPY